MPPFPQEYFLQSLNSGHIALYDFTSNFTRKLMVLGTDSFNFPNARKLDTSLLFSSIRGMRYSPFLCQMNYSSVPWFHSIFLFHLLSFLSLIFHIAGSPLFPSQSGFKKYSMFSVSFCYLSVILNSKFCTYAIKNTVFKVIPLCRRKWVIVLL